MSQMSSKHKLRLSKKIYWFFLLGALTSIISVSLTSCGGVSSSITKNMVKIGDGTKFSNDLSFDDVVKMAATNKTGSTAFKNSVANEIAYMWYKNVVDGVYNNRDRQQYQDNWKKWQKQIDKDYDAKVKTYKNDHKSNWQYYFQNEVLDPVGGTKDNWKKYDSTSGMCQYIIKDMQTRAQAQSYMAIPDPSSLGSGYAYKWDSDILLSSSDHIIDTGTHDFLGSTGQLAPSKWNLINFFVKAANPDPNGTERLDRFFVALQKEAFNEWLARQQPISTSDILWKYSLGDKKLTDIYNSNYCKVDTPNYSFPFFDDKIDPTADTKTANQKYSDFFNDFNSTTDINCLWNSSGYTDTNNLALTNIKQINNDGDGSTMSLFTNDGYSKLNEFGGPAILSLWDAYKNNAGIINATNKTPAKILTNDGKFNTSGSDTNDTILANFLRENNIGITGYADLSSWYGTDSSSGKCNIFNSSSNTNILSQVKYMTNAFQIRKDASTLTPYFFYRGDDGAHIIGLDGTAYLSAPVTSSYINMYGNWATEPFSRERENALIKYRSMYESTIDNAPAGKGLKINDAFKGYLSSNFADVLINTYYRTEQASSTPVAPGTYWWNPSNIDDKFDWHLEFPYIVDVENYLVQVNALFDWQTLTSLYSDSNKKLYAFGKKYADNMKNPNGSSNQNQDDGAKLNGLAMALPWTNVATSGPANASAITNKTTLMNNIMHFDNLSYLLSRIDGSTSNQVQIKDTSLLELTNNAKNAFISWTAENNDVVPLTSNKGSQKYSEHILCKNHLVADMLWGALGDNNGRISNYERYNALKNYVNSIPLPSSTQNAIISQYMTQKVISDDTSLPNYFFNSSVTMADYMNIVLSRFNNSSSIDVSSISNISDNVIDYFMVQARVAWLVNNNFANFISYLQNIAGLRDSENLSKLTSPSVIAWIAKDNFAQSGIGETNISGAYSFRNNFNNQYDNRYNFTNSSSPSSRSYATYNEYWKYCNLKINSSTNTDGMGFIGLQTKNNLKGLPDDISTMLFDQYRNATGDSTLAGSLYRLGSSQLNINQTLSHIVSLGMDSRTFDAVRSFFDYSLPSDLYAIQTEGASSNNINWIACQQLISRAQNMDEKVGYLSKFLFGGDQWIGVLQDNNTEAKTKINNTLTKPYNITNSGQYVFEPKNENGSVCFGTGNIKTRACVMQINSDVVSGKQADGTTVSDIPVYIQSVIGQDAFYALLAQVATTSVFDSRVIKDVLNFNFGDNQKIHVFDRRFNDDPNLRDWIDDYKTTN